MPTAPRRLRLDQLDQAAYAALLKRTEDDLDTYIEAVRPVIADVAERGDAALIDCALRFDKAAVAPGAIRATAADFAAAEANLGDDIKETLRFAADTIRRFHKAQMPEDMWLKEMSPGVLAGERWTPIRAVACYVPRGKGAFPSAALMTTVPAVVAGVEEIVVLTPPTPDGGIDDATLYACALSGIDTVYKAGGAQAVAAAAYGTQTVPRCDKIVGPGSPWFMAAKRLLAGRIDPGSPAGPSESIVIADSTADVRKVALDVINEAEHGADSSVYLVTDDTALADKVASEIGALYAHMGTQRVDYASAVLSGEHGGILVAPDRNAACAFVNDYAPEHLMVHSADPWPYLSLLRHAGEILLGEHAAISIANFVLGANHVLPTSGGARTASPLSVFDYMKRQTIAHLSREGYDALAGHARTLARYEGFDAHANAVSPLRDGKNTP